MAIYEKFNRSSGRVLGCEIRDEITEEEFEKLLREIEEVIIDGGDVRLLVYVPEFPSFDLDLLDEDIGFWLVHGDDIDCYTIVGDNTLMEWAVVFEDLLTSIEFQHFDADDLDEAWTWLE